MDNDCILKVSNLTVSFGDRQVVSGINYSVSHSRTMGIVGESGSGKSVSSLALMGLLPPSATVSGQAMLDGTNLLSLDEKQLQHIRGNRISMIFQEPMTSLNPVQRCGHQVMEMLMAHSKEKTKYDISPREQVIELFREVMLPRPEKIFDSYPHEISGGQKQRVMIAMALINHPDIIIADEPTTALDVTVQKAILQLLRSLQQKYHIGIIFITHDLGVIAQIADDVAVMYQGNIVEQGLSSQVLYHPQHPYTRGLLACRPPLDSRPDRLPTVKDFLDGINVGESPSPKPPSTTPITKQENSVPLLRVRDLGVTYTLQRNILGRPTQQLQAVDGISFDIYRGETVGLVGESGCGKSTLGRAILQLIQRSAGTIEYDGTSLDSLSRKARMDLRRKIQIVFQDPYSSLNPRLTIGQAITEPLQRHHLFDSYAQRRQRAIQLLQQVGLDEDCFNRYPHEFSGGQRQRVCIARALALEPELVVCDESVSALDVSVQAQVLNLLNDLKAQSGYTYLFITHDLSVVKFFSDRIMVMQNGRIVEEAPSDQLFASPQQPYTQQLLDAIPRM